MIPIFLLSQLVEHTIDFLHDSTDDLKRCSLVARPWLPAARYHLFSYFAFQERGDPKRMMPALRSLVAHPTLVHISVLMTEDPIFLLSFFLHRTSNLGTLEIGPRFYREQDEHDEWSSEIQNQVRPPIQVECLCLPTVISRLPSNGSVDFTALKRLVITECAELRAFRAILQECKTSLTNLEIAGFIVERPESESFRNKANIGLETLAQLEHFMLHIDFPNMLAAIPILLSGITPGTALQRVTLVVSRDCAPSFNDADVFAHVDYWNAIDEAIARLGPTSLIIRVLLTAGGVLESGVGVLEELRTYFPRLGSTRRLLLVAIP
ncbi:hypothetical protein B0H13DRAFT_1983948 [Mycena leptocephala]|nr:hypothetical protein B0H13DRAFT_1983948 [Mycena leptocephala]